MTVKQVLCLTAIADVVIQRIGSQGALDWFNEPNELLAKANLDVESGDWTWRAPYELLPDAGWEPHVEGKQVMDAALAL